MSKKIVIRNLGTEPVPVVRGDGSVVTIEAGRHATFDADGGGAVTAWPETDKSEASEFLQNLPEKGDLEVSITHSEKPAQKKPAAKKSTKKKA